jgi:hypothetical protein
MKMITIWDIAPCSLVEVDILERDYYFFPVPVCAITASGVLSGTLVSMNRFSTLCGRLVQRQGWRVKG